MRLPQIIVCAPDSWIADQVRREIREAKILLHEATRFSAVLEMLRVPRPTVVFAQTDAKAGGLDALRFVAEAASLQPDASIVVVSDTKLPDEQRLAWAAAAFDLGARWVLFPPLMKTELIDLALALMTANISRQIRGSSSEAKRTPRIAKKPIERIASGEPEVIDLAEGDYVVEEDS